MNCIKLKDKKVKNKEKVKKSKPKACCCSIPFNSCSKANSTKTKIKTHSSTNKTQIFDSQKDENLTNKPLMVFGAIQFGAAAAIVVVLIPMGMAGWHLSRNKMLFFSGTLFISLAVCVHLTPYFPSVPNFVASVSTAVIFDHRSSCIDLVNDVYWEVKPNKTSKSHDKNWGWTDSNKVKACEFSKLSRSDVSDLLNGSWVVIAGDSQARLFTISLLNLLLGHESERMELVRGELFKRHSDYTVFLNESGVKLDFLWAPYVVNLTDLVIDYETRKICPDVLIMGAGLWDMLHVNNASDYDSGLRNLKSEVVSLLSLSTELVVNEPVIGSVPIKSSHLFWLGMPMLINGMLNTEEKREKMTDATWHAYDKALGDSRVLRQTGGPLVLLDFQSLSWNCGPHCTIDGMHYDGAIYDAGVQIMLNILLIESHQSL